MIDTDSTGESFEVADLDPDQLLALITDTRIECWKAERRLLRLAFQWCVLHPVPEDGDHASWDPAGSPGDTPAETIGGDGTPLVAVFAPEPFAAALGVSTLAGIQLMADALDLQHRLPHLWQAVEELKVAPWRARKIAHATHQLSLAGARSVDAELSQHTGGYAVQPGWPTLEKLLGEAIATHDPHLVETKQKRGRRAWDVKLQHRGVLTGDSTWAGTSHLDVTGDTLDLTHLYDLICTRAEALRAAGDTDPLGVRKAKALGQLARGETTPDISPGDPSPQAGPAPRRRPKVKLYLHLSGTDILADPTEAGAKPRFGTAERLGPLSIEKIRAWAGASQTTIVPVLDMNRLDGIEQHDPPAWLRELVTLRDEHCIFPHCNRPARASDLDHIQSWQSPRPPDQPRHPPQTRPHALAPLCRRHHRAKTARRWRYRRTPAGNYLWRGPHHRTYLVTPAGTVSLD